MGFNFEAQSKIRTRRCCVARDYQKYLLLTLYVVSIIDVCQGGGRINLESSPDKFIGT